MLETMDKTIVSSPEELIEGLDLKAITWQDNQHRRGVREIVMAYDSETTQIDKNVDGIYKEFYATQICHQLCIEDKGIMVRTEDEMMELLLFLYQNLCYYNVRKVKNKKGKIVEIVESMSIIIYVQNLSFDITFLLYKLVAYCTKHFIVKGSFSTFELSNCIIFKDSKKLLGHGLEVAVREYLGEDSPYYKRCGLWDYSTIRSPLYELTNDEIEYGMVDVFALIEILKAVMRNNNCLYSNLPVSQSTFVGRKMYDKLIGGNKKWTSKKTMDVENREFYDTIHKLNLDYEMFLEAKQAFYGGVSFTNPLYVNKYIENPGDYDLSSEYPRALAGQLFPMTEPVRRSDITTEAQLEEHIKIREGHEEYRDCRGGFIAKLTFYGYQSKKEYPIPFLFSKIDENKEKFEGRNVVMNGKRVYAAEMLSVYLTDVDYKIVKKTATWNFLEIDQVITYDMKPLPKKMVRLLLECYRNKTSLKGIIGEETKYMDSKVFVNTIYGKQAQSPIHDAYELDEETGKPYKIPKTYEEQCEALETANNKENRTTYYLWGVYTASYGHMFLYHGMTIVKEDIRFCDTDSVKYANRELYEEAFADYNRENEEHLRFIGKYWFNFTDEEVSELFFPKTPSGEVKPIGNWDSEVDDKKLGKMVGAISKRSKCYVIFYEDENGNKNMRFTVAGCSKENLERYCRLTMCKTEEEVYEKGLFKREECNPRIQQAIRENIGLYETPEEFFISSPYIPPEFSGKLTKYVSYNQPEYTYTDEQGNEWTMKNSSAVYLEPCSFKLNDPEGIDIIQDILRKRIISYNQDEQTDGFFR